MGWTCVFGTESAKPLFTFPKVYACGLIYQFFASPPPNNGGEGGVGGGKQSSTVSSETLCSLSHPLLWAWWS